MARFVLLDRDGVINRKIDRGYVTSWKEFAFLPEALDALRLFHTAGYLPLVISNQAGVGSGQMAEARLHQITTRFLRRVEATGGHIEKVYYCTHSKHAHCNCRKPQPGLILEAQREFHFDLAETYFVGDSESDLLAARRAGCPMIMVNSNPAGHVKDWIVAPQGVAASLKAAADFIVAQSGARP